MRTLVLAAVVLAAGCGKPATTSDVRAAANGKEQARKTYTRDEFRNLIIGKTPDQVLKAVGKPDRTREITGMNVWYYDATTTDPVTGKVDRAAQVIFEQGVVDRVSY